MHTYIRTYIHYFTRNIGQLKTENFEGKSFTGFITASQKNEQQTKILNLQEGPFERRMFSD